MILKPYILTNSYQNHKDFCKFDEYYEKLLLKFSKNIIFYTKFSNFFQIQTENKDLVNFFSQ